MVDKDKPLAENAAPALLGPNEVLIAEELVTPDEQDVLSCWAEDKFRRGRLLQSPADPGVYLTHYRSASGDLSRFTRGGSELKGEDGQHFVYVPPQAAPRDPLPDIFWRIGARALDRLGAPWLAEDPYKGSFLTYAAPGGSVHRHCDAKVRADDEDCEILRCNVLFRRPMRGGQPVIRSASLDIPDRGMWAFFPTALVHSATEVQDDWRGTLSFGFLVRAADLHNRGYRLSASICDQYGLDEGEDSRARLISQLRGASGVAALGGERLAHVEYAVRVPGAFSVRDAAGALGKAPAATAAELIDLQRVGFLESVSSIAARGAIRVL